MNKKQEGMVHRMEKKRSEVCLVENVWTYKEQLCFGSLNIL